MSHLLPRSARSRAARVAIGAFAALTLTVGLGGCSSAGGDGTTKLSFFSWDNEATMTPVIDAFEAEHPDISIEFSAAPPVAEYISALQTRLVAGTAADVFIIAAENKTNLIDGGFVKDLTDEPFMQPMSPFNTETYGSDGKAYGMSVSSWAGGILYNKSILADAGIDELPTDWDGFLDALQTLKDTGVTPFYDSASAMPLTLAALVGSENAAQGGDVDSAIFDGSATFGDLWDGPFADYEELFDRGLMTPDVISLTGDQISDEFINGRVAMITAGPWTLPGIREAAPDLDITFAPVPTPDGAGFWAGAASPGYAINAKTDKTEAAETFLDYLGSEAGLAVYQEASSAMTTTSNFTPSIDDALQPNLAGLTAGDFYLPQIAWPRYQDALNMEAVAQLQLLIQGSSSPEDVAGALEARLQEQQG